MRDENTRIISIHSQQRQASHHKTGNVEMRKCWRVYGPIVVVAAVVVAGISFITRTDEARTISTLAEQTHFHGIAFDRSDASQIYLATHHGLYVADLSGNAELVSETRDDLMGFTPHPNDPSILFASGHPATRGNLGFVVSKDGGASWAKLSDGVGGPVDFHQMDVSKADPKIVYGVYRGLQRSSDGGHSWTRIGLAPDAIIQLAASSQDPDTIYAATEGGLLRSADQGRNWQPANLPSQPVTMVHTTHGANVYAYVVGTGLIRAAEDELDWHLVNNNFDGGHILHFAADPGRDDRRVAVTMDTQTRQQMVRITQDGGANWRPLGAD